MNCLFIVPYPRFFSQHQHVGGHAAHVAGMVEGLVSEGVNVDVLCEESSPWLALVGARQIIHSHSGGGLIGRVFWSTALVLKVRRMAQSKKYHFCYMRYSAGFTPWIPILQRLLGTLPLILEVNSLGSQWYPSMRFLDRRSLKSAGNVVVISNTLRDWVLANIQVVSRKRLKVVPNAISTSRFAHFTLPLQDELLDYLDGQKANGAFVYGYLGVIKPQYGLEELIAAHDYVVKQIPNAHLFIVGDGPHLGALRALVASNESIHLPGGIDPSLVPPLLAKFDVLVYTTNLRYVFQSPVKMYEYMASGVPVIAAETRQTKELVGASQERGLLFTLGSTQAMASTIFQVYSDPDVASRRSKRARDYVFAAHTWQHRARLITGLIQNRSTTDG